MNSSSVMNGFHTRMDEQQQWRLGDHHLAWLPAQW
jgi:hypothetical protein